MGKVINSTLERGWLYGNHLGPDAELAADGTTVTKRFIYGTRSWVPDAMIHYDGTPGGVLYRIVTDQLGSVRMVVNASTGVVTNRYVYDEWGNLDKGSPLDKDSGNEFVPFGFAGGLYDPDTGLIQFGAPEYEPTLGRFITADPTLFAGGLNLYAYAGNNPVNFVDPEGTHPVIAAIAWGFAFDVSIQMLLNGGRLHCVDYESAAGWSMLGALGGGVAVAFKAVRAAKLARAGRKLYHYTSNQAASAIRSSGGLKASPGERLWGVNSSGVHDAGFFDPATGMGSTSATPNVFFTDVAPKQLNQQLASEMGIVNTEAVFVAQEGTLREAGILVFQNPSHRHVFNAVIDLVPLRLLR